MKNNKEMISFVKPIGKLEAKMPQMLESLSSY